MCYVIVGEIIAMKIKENREIKGLNMGNKIRNILSQFADDTVLFLKFEKITLDGVIQTFEHLEANTGLRINYDKTVVYRIGSIKNTNAKLYTQKELKWSNESFDLLGLEISNSEMLMTDNYKKVLEKMHAICDQWRERAKLLTLTGRNTNSKRTDGIAICI